MEKLNNRTIILGTFIIIVLAISLDCGIIVYKNHLNKRLMVMEKEITEAALSCYASSTCPSKIITLQDLYDKNYLEEMVNPQNKEFLNPNSTITIDNFKATLEIVK